MDDFDRLHGFLWIVAFCEEVEKLEPASLEAAIHIVLQGERRNLRAFSMQGVLQVWWTTHSLRVP